MLALVLTGLTLGGVVWWATAHAETSARRIFSLLDFRAFSFGPGEWTLKILGPDDASREDIQQMLFALTKVRGQVEKVESGIPLPPIVKGGEDRGAFVLRKAGLYVARVVIPAGEKTETINQEFYLKLGDTEPIAGKTTGQLYLLFYDAMTRAAMDRRLRFLVIGASP